MITQSTKKFILLACFFFISALIIALPRISKAEAFVVHLYYSQKTKQLVFDKASKEKVSYDKDKFVSIQEFAFNNATGAYVLKIYDNKGSEIASTEFNSQNGSFSIDLPYFSLAKTLKIFEKASNSEMLSADLLAFSTCNGNGICEFEKGENLNNCLGDCGTAKPSFSPETQKLLDQNGGVIKDPQTGQILLKEPAPPTPTSSEANLPVPIQSNQTAPAQTSATANSIPLLIVALLLISGGIGIFVYMKRKKNKS